MSTPKSPWAQASIEYYENMVKSIVQQARKEGFVITVEEVSVMPPVTGKTIDVVKVRPARGFY